MSHCVENNSIYGQLIYIEKEALTQILGAYRNKKGGNRVVVPQFQTKNMLLGSLIYKQKYATRLPDVLQGCIDSRSVLVPGKHCRRYNICR